MIFGGGIEGKGALDLGGVRWQIASQPMDPRIFSTLILLRALRYF